MGWSCDCGFDEKIENMNLRMNIDDLFQTRKNDIDDIAWNVVPEVLPKNYKINHFEETLKSNKLQFLLIHQTKSHCQFQIRQKLFSCWIIDKLRERFSYRGRKIRPPSSLATTVRGWVIDSGSNHIINNINNN